MKSWTFDEFEKDFIANKKEKPKGKSMYALYLESLNKTKKDSKVSEEVENAINDLITCEKEEEGREEVPDNSSWWRKLLSKLSP